jgi:serine phosphatase RsbU (regulator of sigma subunit)/pSer/pThr/pTyr-binding forkhead associated (FHA) protein
MAFLSLRNGTSVGQSFPIDDDSVVLGRHPDCAIVVDGSAVSRKHARVFKDGENFYVEDLKSRNKTFLNSTEMPPGTPQQLKDGDIIGICDSEFLFHVAAKSADPSSSILFVDDDSESSNSTIMSKVGVSSNYSGVQLTASTEAKLNALLEITRNLGRALALDEVLPQVLNSLFKIFVQADRGFIALQGEDGKLVPRWSRAWREDVADTIRVSRTIVNQVMESQEAILSADAATDSRFEMSQSIADFRIRSMMCAPLIDSEGKSMGVLQIDTLKQNKRFQPEDLEVLVAVATQAGIAIDNAQLHDRSLRQREVERDLELAHEVQHGFLPEDRPSLEGYEFFDFYQPANLVGGDYFDYLSLPDGKTAIVVADVVGHGIAAALMMAKLSAESRFCLASASEPSKAIRMLNDRLCGLQVDRFVTAAIIVLDPNTHTVSIANAGHMAPIYYRADGSIDEPGADVAGLPLGIMDGMDYQQASVRLQPGESMTLYTDGLNEAADPTGKLYTIERIRKKVAASKGSPASLGEDLVNDVQKFIGGGAQLDDMCFVVFGRGD